MGGISDSFSILYLGAAAGVYFKPEHVICNSRVVTLVVLFGVITVSRLIYRLVLYPEYFTPLKHIHTGPVSAPSVLLPRTG